MLLLVSLGALSWFAHQALKDEAMHNAQQMLSGTVQQVDNILVNVEQSTDFVYQDLRNHLSQRDRMFTYCSRIVESSLMNGLGLGLPLCKRHANSLGGDLTLDTDYLEGARFVLEVPK